VRANSTGSGRDDGSFDARERTLLSQHEMRAIERLDRELALDDPKLAELLRKMKARRRLLPSWLRRGR
jgi:hypothetical protein